MKQADLEDQAIAEIEQMVAGITPEPRVVRCEGATEWNPVLLARVAEHELHVLARGGDIVVFFGGEGNEIGWRDDGRTGAAQPGWIDRESFRAFVVRELELPEETRLGQLQPRLLPPIGWTHEGVLFLSPTPTPDQVLRVWVDPEHDRVIQCLYGPANAPCQGAVS